MTIGRGGSTVGDGQAQVPDLFFLVALHGDGGGTGCSVINAHPKKLVDFATSDLHHTEMAFNVWVNMGDLCVVNIPHDGALSIVERCIGDT